jgi:hypothetical protein
MEGKVRVRFHHHAAAGLLHLLDLGLDPDPSQNRRPFPLKCLLCVATCCRETLHGLPHERRNTDAECGEVVYFFPSLALHFSWPRPLIFACMLRQLPALHMHPYWARHGVCCSISNLFRLRYLLRNSLGLLAPPCPTGANGSRLPQAISGHEICSLCIKMQPADSNRLSAYSHIGSFGITNI